jgi:membrane-associated phospholipid phosphatase
VLGVLVSVGLPSGIDAAARPIAGEALPLARICTESCWWYVLVAYAIGAIVLAVRSPQWRGRVVFSVVTTLITWQLSDFLKNLFGRPRPEYWRLIHETSYSYPSGHAMFAVLVYGLWAWFVWNSELPRTIRRSLTPLLVLWALGILWSRLALGAHYVTDLIGGLLLATTALSLAAAIASAIRAGRTATA